MHVRRFALIWFYICYLPGFDGHCGSHQLGVGVRENRRLDESRCPALERAISELEAGRGSDGTRILVLRRQLVDLHGESRFRFRWVDDGGHDSAILAAVFHVPQRCVIRLVDRKVEDDRVRGAARSAVDIQSCVIRRRGAVQAGWDVRCLCLRPFHIPNELALLPCPRQVPVVDPRNRAIVRNRDLQASPGIHQTIRPSITDDGIPSFLQLVVKYVGVVWFDLHVLQFLPISFNLHNTKLCEVASANLWRSISKNQASLIYLWLSKVRVLFIPFTENRGPPDCVHWSGCE